MLVSRSVWMCCFAYIFLSLFFFFNATAPTEIYTLSLHDALPISTSPISPRSSARPTGASCSWWSTRSEEHTFELQSRRDLVCRLLLEKKKKRHDHGGRRLRQRRVARTHSHCQRQLNALPKQSRRH